MSDFLDVLTAALGANVNGGPAGLPGGGPPFAADPGINASGGDSTGSSGPGNSNPAGGGGGGSADGSASPRADWWYWLNPFNYDPGPAFRAGQDAGQAAKDSVFGPIWQDIKTGAPVVGVYGLLAALFLIGAASLFFASSPGQALVGGAVGEVNAKARAKGKGLITPPKAET